MFLASPITFPNLGITVDPSPVAFTVFGKDIYWYGSIIAAGFLLAVFYMLARAKDFGITQDDVLDMILGAVPSGVSCARLYYCIFYWELYEDDPISMLYIWEGSLAISGAIIGGVLAICIFLSKKANDIVGRVAQILGGIIIVVMLVVAFMAKPPVGDAVVHIFTPENPKELIPVMVTLLGGSCGGYITFSGAHKLLDAGWGGKPEEVKHFRKSVLTGICVSGSDRFLLFLCVLGVCTAGTVVVAENVAAVTGAANPAAEAFRLAAGDIGYRLFGLALFSAGITSVIGAAYTSVSFLKTVHPFIAKNDKWFIVGFIAFSTLVMAILGGAKRMVILAGALNGLILPISLCCMLLGCHKKSIVGEYKHPVWLQILGWCVVGVAGYLAVTALPNLAKLFA